MSDAASAPRTTAKPSSSAARRRRLTIPASREVEHEVGSVGRRHVEQPPAVALRDRAAIARPWPRTVRRPRAARNNPGSESGSPGPPSVT